MLKRLLSVESMMILSAIGTLVIILCIVFSKPSTETTTWYREGQEARQKGLPPEACPYSPAGFMSPGKYREDWLKGWGDAKLNCENTDKEKH